MKLKRQQNNNKKILLQQQKLQPWFYTRDIFAYLKYFKKEIYTIKIKLATKSELEL